MAFEKSHRLILSEVSIVKKLVILMVKSLWKVSFIVPKIVKNLRYFIPLQAVLNLFFKVAIDIDYSSQYEQWAPRDFFNVSLRQSDRIPGIRYPCELLLYPSVADTPVESPGRKGLPADGLSVRGGEGPHYRQPPWWWYI